MIPYIGDFAEDATIYHYFNTFDSNDPSASVTITNLADADLKVHKDGSVTQATTDGATIAIDFDTITGTHKVTIDTSADAYYAVGSDYMVRMEGTTVDAGTINAALFTFSIENRYNAAADDLANATDGLGALKTLIDTLTTNVATVDTVVDRIEVDTQDLQTQVGTAGAGLTNIGTITTVTNLTNLPTIPANWLTAAGIAASALDGKGNWNVGKTGYTVSTVSDKTGYSLTATTGLGNQTANITGNLSGSVGSVTGAVGSVTGAVGSVTAEVTADAVKFGGAAVTATTSVTIPASSTLATTTGAVGSVTGAVGSVTGHTPQTGDSFAIANGAAGFVAIDTVVDAIKAKTDSLTFTVAGNVDANTQYINDAGVVGDGNATPWDGA